MASPPWEPSPPLQSSIAADRKVSLSVLSCLPPPHTNAHWTVSKSSLNGHQHMQTCGWANTHAPAAVWPVLTHKSSGLSDYSSQQLSPKDRRRGGLRGEYEKRAEKLIKKRTGREDGMKWWGFFSETVKNVLLEKKRLIYTGTYFSW